jgi:hypothetical protein
MTYFMLNAILTRALLDAQFSKDILNGKRYERISEYELTPLEKKAILSIEAEDMDQFIHQITNWMYTQENRPVLNALRN